VVEIVSPGSEAMDEVVKRNEYARAGIPRYWLVERDTAQTVTLHVLGADKTYDVAAKMPLAWLLQTSPVDHHLGDRPAGRAPCSGAETVSALLRRGLRRSW
jgi:hypothetical protein